MDVTALLLSDTKIVLLFSEVAIVNCCPEDARIEASVFCSPSVRVEKILLLMMPLLVGDRNPTINGSIEVVR
jgi:hypothetical protein